MLQMPFLTLEQQGLMAQVSASSLTAPVFSFFFWHLGVLHGPSPLQVPAVYLCERTSLARREREKKRTPATVRVVGLGREARRQRLDELERRVDLRIPRAFLFDKKTRTQPVRTAPPRQPASSFFWLGSSQDTISSGARTTAPLPASIHADSTASVAEKAQQLPHLPWSLTGDTGFGAVARQSKAALRLAVGSGSAILILVPGSTPPAGGR